MTLQILSPLHRATRQVQLSLETSVSNLDLSADEGHALTYIAAYGPCPTGNVQRVIGSRRSTITSLLDRLVKRGLLKRSKDKADGRVLLIAVTAKGRSLAQKAAVSAKKLEARISGELSSRDLAAFKRIIAAIDTATGVTVVKHTRSDGQR